MPVTTETQTGTMIAYTLYLLIQVYTLLLLARILGSWFPDFRDHPVMRFISYYTDPYLNIFRRIIPPLGPIDISPIFAFLALQLFGNFLIGLLS